MKILFFAFAILMSSSTFSQKFFTRTGNTDFTASVESFKPEVAAKNNSTTVIFKTETGDIASQLFINAFQFKIALMQEHFNENYMDSHKYPKATFRGKVIGFYFFDAGVKKDYSLTGELTIRGVKKQINTTASVILLDDKIKITSNFIVKASDFNIDIPSIVRKKIAERINILIDYELTEKK